MPVWTRALLAFAVLLFSSRAALAQDVPASAKKRAFLVLPVTRNDEALGRLQGLADEVAKRLSSRGVRQVSHHEAASLFEAAHSREPQPVTQDDIDALLSESALASRASADGRASEAKKHVELALGRASGALESLGRDEAAARAYFSACRAQVRALISDHDRDGALRAARECRAAVPDLDPSPTENPPSVMQVFADVKREAQARGTGLLRVDSDPSECKVIVNGRFLGRTPYAQRAPLGQKSKLQVECGEPLPGRVHEVTISDEPLVLTIDSFFEHSVRTSRGVLRLAYERSDDPSVRAHSLKVGEILHAKELVLLSMSTADTIDLHRVGYRSTSVSAHNAREELEAALDFLLEADAPKAGNLADEARTQVDHFPKRAKRPHKGYPLRRLIVGTALSSAGLVSWGLGIAKYGQHREDGRQFRAAPIMRYPGALREWQDSRTAPYLGVGIGAAAIAAGALVLAEPIPLRHRRWLGPTLAAAGATLVTLGAVELGRGGACDTSTQADLRFCAVRQEQRDRGALILLSAVPFLTLSLTEFVQWLRGDDLETATLSTTGRSVDLTVRF
jgi:hypothetical protein